MKTVLLLLMSTASLLAQSKFSLAPTYSFNYGIYSYQLRAVYDGSIKDFSGHSTGSSIGLTARYHFDQRWSLSVGALYDKSVSHLKTPTSDDVRLPATEEFRFPVLVNYRLSNRRLAPYLSAGAFFAKDKKDKLDDPLRTTRTHALLGIGVDYKINSKLSWLLQPTASYMLTKPANQLPFQFASYNSYWIGLQTQLLIHF